MSAGAAIIMAVYLGVTGKAEVTTANTKMVAGQEAAVQMILIIIGKMVSGGRVARC